MPPSEGCSGKSVGCAGVGAVGAYLYLFSEDLQGAGEGAGGPY